MPVAPFASLRPVKSLLLYVVVGQTHEFFVKLARHENIHFLPFIVLPVKTVSMAAASGSTWISGSQRLSLKEYRTGADEKLLGA